MAAMKVFNTLTNRKEELIPGRPEEIRVYVCGPTVYSYVHIGNARTFTTLAQQPAFATLVREPAFTSMTRDANFAAAVRAN